MKTNGNNIVDLVYAIAMIVVLWKDEIVLESKFCYCHTSTLEEATYEQVIIHDGFNYGVPNSFWNIHKQ